MKAIALLAISTLTMSSSAFAGTYCGRVQCAPVLDGCRVNDGNTNPIVLIADESGRKYNYVSRQIADAIEAKDWKCACVVGNVAI